MALKNTKEKVVKLMEEHKLARNNDKALFAFYVNEYHPEIVFKDQEGRKSVRLADFGKLPNFESIRRSRAIIQNDDGKLLPTDEGVIKARGHKEKDYRDKEIRDAKNHDVYA